MKLSILSLPLSLFISTAALAQEDANAEDDVTRLAIIGLEANGVPKELARALSETVATRADKTGVFETVSPVQLTAVIALDKSRWAMGNCSDEACFAKLAQAVSADHAIGGSVGKAGEMFVLNLVLVDVASAKALKRTEKREKDPSKLLEQAAFATVELVQPILSDRSGFARIDSNVAGAQITTNGERSPHRVGQVFSLPAGPHVIKAATDGFYPTTVDVNVKPGRITPVQLTLVPAPETVRAYKSEANTMRTIAWITAGVAIASAGASAVFYDQSSQNLNAVESYVGLNSFEQANATRPTGDSNSFDTNQGLYITFLSTAVVSGLVSAGLFIFGPDPGKYSEFDDLSDD